MQTNSEGKIPRIDVSTNSTKKTKDTDGSKPIFDEFDKNNAMRSQNIEGRRQQRVILTGMTHENAETNNKWHNTRILRNNSASAKLKRKSAGLGDRPLSGTNQHVNINRHVDEPQTTAEDIFKSCYDTTTSRSNLLREKTHTTTKFVDAKIDGRFLTELPTNQFSPTSEVGSNNDTRRGSGRRYSMGSKRNTNGRSMGEPSELSGLSESEESTFNILMRNKLNQASGATSVALQQKTDNFHANTTAKT